ncbi:EscU/YscU/HrcU family type III secretion system export apparatus switch protein [Kushneria indalinina]|uniref:Flagellar biosynthetic protein FlhB n=1 Tax=Kushneria indalinina DSM 14324 TaxID=1122140 RepID=A0A3D9E1M9_9GAMM|nr:EscU/YscU/HrcU family type III secretion system export apparatus switch protein [Kushneria indalinina]REC96364.1 flagellar biosynthesis protein [Kushneria indalinina DSM 14324]
MTPSNDQPSKRQRAVAIAHDINDAPRVVAKGYGTTADAIMEKAQASGVYVHQSAELVNLLLHVDLDDRIPQELYLALAELLCWIHELEQDAASVL